MMRGLVSMALATAILPAAGMALQAAGRAYRSDRSAGSVGRGQPGEVERGQPIDVVRRAGEAAFVQKGHPP